MTDALRKYTQEKIQKKDFDCAKEYTLSMFSGKYKIVIIYHLFHDGTMRFNQIQRLLDDATHKMLAQQLKELTADGLVTRREEIANNRKATYYSLTATGESLMPIIEDMFTWGTKRLEALELAGNFKLH
ncbi:helix-turn-helix transcriptional regulator [Lactobacillus sp. LC28-10]|uniref:Helix-turn-helix transcriptional regulator n=1 Tax=Secundilactobacillus angelensis TaxID=2722706 RepID=A0ABX1L365_9LACO|nr:helix-turn-helix domain-containing protein [Secundilactobacillus angelensis]MCH5462851.1 helix-turn-helix transcriptional regulator [Secundilactobacillus angelensis]NLR18771.1 helix-turn-helix transcriptional regulator [Secundilactobacillus angelensis]